MSKKQECNHVIGYIESDGYDGSILTEFVNYQYFNLSTANDLKSSKGSLYSFCPDCGKKLEGLIDKRIDNLTAEKNRIIEEDRIKREKFELSFRQKVSEVSKQTNLDQLPEEGLFAVVFHPTNSSYGKDVVLAGSKESILRNCVHYNSNKYNPDPLVKKVIYKALSHEDLRVILTDNGWEEKGTKVNKYLEKMDGNKCKQLSLDSSGIIYINEKSTDPEDGYVSTNYETFAIHRLSGYLGFHIDLETINIKD